MERLAAAAAAVAAAAAAVVASAALLYHYCLVNRELVMDHSSYRSYLEKSRI